MCCERLGTECVAEQLWASEEGLFCVTLVVCCNDFTVVVLKMYKEAAVISVLIKMYNIHCHNRGHINVMLVLQSCTDTVEVLSGSSSEYFPTSSDGVCNFINIKSEEDVDVKEVGFIAINEEEDIGIKQEDIPDDKNFPHIKSETDEVSFVCISVIRHILPESRNIICVYDVSISGRFTQFHCWKYKCFPVFDLFLVVVVGTALDGLVCR
jgi:hypothetical protein